MRIAYGIRMVVLLCLLAGGHRAVAQGHHVYLNGTDANAEQQKVFGLWKQYLTQPNNTDTLWAAADRAKYKGTDILKEFWGMDGTLYKIRFDCNVLGITKAGDNYVIRAALYWNEQDTLIPGKFTLFAVVNVLAVPDGATYKLSNYINYSTAGWLQQRVGRIVYHYPPSYSFDIFKAREANTFLDSVGHWFGCGVDTLNYYIPLNCTESFKMAGFEYHEGEGTELNLCGFYDGVNHLIYSNYTQGVYYKHELIHIVNDHYPHANNYLLCGIAAYIDDAGSVGKPERFHIRRFQAWLRDHPTDLNKFYDLRYVDEVTAPNYVLGAAICNALMRKGGLPLLRKAMTDISKDDDLAGYLRTTFKTQDLNLFFSNEFRIYLEQKDVLLRTQKEE